ncbi:hypothetical protein TL16_g09587 [Triparma laevis f. inornata]|uniref:Kinesin light chain n=1 Tax=Triparma laevis f. inornata TaxID=1714386 RepID=A0A9W7B939_9STRA|nr:hypothetical protein TL16_g09587 [Triparma laevis f. inornata]
MNIAIVYDYMEDYVKAEELYERALEGKEAQLGKDHESTKECVNNCKNCLEESGNNVARLEELLIAYLWLKNNVMNPYLPKT